MSRTRIAASLAGISSVLLLAGIIIIRTLPLEAEPQVKDAPGVSVGVAEANLLHRVAVEYPQEARDKRIEGNVVLEIEIDENGTVSDARVVSGPQELRRAALQSVLQWHYAKSMPLPAHTQVTVNFQLPPATAAELKPQPAIVTPTPVQRGTSSVVLRIIDLSSLPEQLRNELQPKLAAYEGQPFSDGLMREIYRTAHSVDRHLVFRSSTGAMQEGELPMSLSLSLNTAAPAPAARAQAAPTPVPQAAGAAPQRIRVGGNVQQTMLVEKTRPVYPPAAKQAHIQGLVRLEAIIGKDGTVQGLTVTTGHPLLVPSALEAVKQWVYRPTLLNGEPVEVLTQIDVNYTLAE